MEKRKKRTYHRGVKLIKILICGIDGYLGWPLAMHLVAWGHEIFGVDNFSRRARVKEAGSISATPIRPIEDRIEAYRSTYGFDIGFYEGDLMHGDFVDLVMERERPDCLIHLGEIPSAPYSMIDREHCNETQINNIVGTNNLLFAMRKYVPDCHMVKLGSMGTYGTPNIDIPEGFFDIEYRGRSDTLPFPRQAGSWYHLSKVHDTHNIMFACKVWGLRSTDIHQGVVHGVVTEEMRYREDCLKKQYQADLLTRFDFDEVWGTALNRFCAQAVIGHKLTPYGAGGQTRGYIALRDSVQCMKIVAENPPEKGEYRVFNQFDECYSVNELVEHVIKVAAEFNIEAEAWNVENPRVEAEKHYYNPDHNNLHELGFEPTHSLDDELRITFPVLKRYRHRIQSKRQHMMPTVKWRK